MSGAMAEPDLFQRLHGPASGLGMMGELQRQGRVLQSGHGRDEVKGLKDDTQMLAPKAGQGVLTKLRQVRPGHLHPPRRGAFQTGHEHEHGRLARTRRAYHGQGLTLTHAQGDPTQDVDRAGTGG